MVSSGNAQSDSKPSELWEEGHAELAGVSLTTAGPEKAVEAGHAVELVLTLKNANKMAIKYRAAMAELAFEFEVSDSKGMKVGELRHFKQVRAGGAFAGSGSTQELPAGASKKYFVVLSRDFDLSTAGEYRVRFRYYVPSFELGGKRQIPVLTSKPIQLLVIDPKRPFRSDIER